MTIRFRATSHIKGHILVAATFFVALAVAATPAIAASSGGGSTPTSGGADTSGLAHPAALVAGPLVAATPKTCGALAASGNAKPDLCLLCAVKGSGSASPLATTVCTPPSLPVCPVTGTASQSGQAGSYGCPGHICPMTTPIRSVSCGCGVPSTAAQGTLCRCGVGIETSCPVCTVRTCGVCDPGGVMQSQATATAMCGCNPMPLLKGTPTSSGLAKSGAAETLCPINPCQPIPTPVQTLPTSPPATPAPSTAPITSISGSVSTGVGAPSGSGSTSTGNVNPGVPILPGCKGCAVSTANASTTTTCGVCPPVVRSATASSNVNCPAPVPPKGAPPVSPSPTINIRPLPPTVPSASQGISLSGGTGSGGPATIG